MKNAGHDLAAFYYSAQEFGLDHSRSRPLTPSGQFAVFPDQERPDDQVVEHQGAALLLVGQEIAQRVDDTAIDCDEVGPTPRLVMRRG